MLFGPGGMALMVSAVVLGFGSRSLVGTGLPAVGRMQPLPVDPTDLVSSWWLGWRPTGTGTTVVGPDGLALLGFLDGLWPWGSDLLWTLVVLAALPVGAVGVWRLTQPVGGGRSRAVAVLVYLSVPLPYDALRDGRLAPMAAFAVLPWVVRRLVGAQGVAPYGTRGGEAGPGTRLRGLWSEVLVTGLLLGAVAAVDPMLAVPVAMVLAGLVVGTHALLEDVVQFADLGLVVVDEQHRFGVEQRAALTDKAGTPPHVLVMTATPIPRTVAMTVFGDLETSTLSELPAGRAPIQTTVVPLVDAPHWIERVWQRAREEVEKGHQVYVVCPRISGDVTEQGEGDAPAVEGETRPQRPLAAVEEVAAELAEGPLAGLRVGLLHGRLPAEEKDRTMRAFAAGELDVLVSTTVIEVGVDVANATTMVLLDADRFGVSQLHQLRGRVGRGGLPGLCLLVSHAEVGSPARERLDAVASTTDGFELSRVDLEQRREGDVLGASQSGFTSSLRDLRVLRDEKTILHAREVSSRVLDEDPDLDSLPLVRDLVLDLEESVRAEFATRS